MAKINDYFKKKYEKETEDYKKKLARHRLAIFYRILLVVVIVAAIIAIVIYNRRNAVYSDYETLRSTSFSEASAASYLTFNGRVLRFSKDGASAFDMDNNMIWNQTFEMQNPMIDVCGDYAAIGDYKGAQIYIFNGEGLQGKIDTTLPVQRFCVAGNGNVAAVLEEDNVTWIKLFDTKGTLIANDRTTMAKSGYPVRVDLSEDGIMMGVSYLRIDTGTLASSVAFYNFGAVGQNEIDNLVSGYDYSSTVVSEVAFMNAKSSFALGDDRLLIFSGDQKPEVITEVPFEDEVQSVFHNEEYIGLVFVEVSDEAAYRLEVYNTSGEHVNTILFDLDYREILFNKDQIVIYDNKECLITNVAGEEKFRGAFHKSIVTMIPTSSTSKYLLVSGREMEEIQLK